MENLNRLRVGIAGCGYQGGQLARAVAKTQSLRIVACADPNLEAARNVAAQSEGVEVYAAVEEMLDKSVLDAVFVATPHHMLCPVALTAIRAGKHVLAEKPIGMIEAEAIQIEKAVAKAGVCYQAGYSFRYFPGWQRVHELLVAGAVGEIQAITGVFTLPPMLKGWVAAPETGGGPLLFLGSHLIDQVLWYASDTPVEVYANVSRRADTRADDTSVFQIHFASGATAQCVVSQASPSVFNGLNIYGREGHVSMNMVGLGDYEIVVASSKLAEYAQPQTIHPPLADDPRILMHVPQLEAFAQAVRGQGQLPTTVADGRNVLKIIDAVFKSGETCKPIRLI